MKASELFFPTLREVPSEAEVLSHQLLLRAGFIRRATAGIYSYLPLANRVLKKIMDIVREEMDRAGGQEVILPIVQPAELWKKSGRWEVYGDEMFRLKDRHERDFALGPTHEEIITTLVNAEVHSYRQLPVLLYQIQNKYRDEVRPRFGLMRGREFIMKDLYSFDIDEEGLNLSYQKMHEAYKRIFQRLQLRFRVVEADSGAIGGNESHEFMVLAENGEAEIVYCENCDYGANTEKAVCSLKESENVEEEQLELTKVSTPGQRTIQDIVDYMGIPKEKQIKTLIYYADEELVAAIVRGDRELNEIKFRNVLGCNQIFMADELKVKELCSAGFGSLGPVALPLRTYIDLEVSQMRNFACGANEDDYHFINVNPGRDFTATGIYDIRSAVAGDNCPICSAPLRSMRGIEVGHIFKLGTMYSEALEANYLDHKGQEQLMVMGCYGIGVSRTMAAAVEQSADENGIIWPLPIAPFDVIIVPVNSKNEEQMQAAWGLYEEFKQIGLETIIDDRDERAGVKFKDADLIGVPLRVTIGPRSLRENQAEVKKRTAAEVELIPLDAIGSRVKLMLKEMSG